MTARDFDINGFMEIKGNPLSKVGVFPYLGKSIGIPGLDPEGVYNVFRSEDELSDQDCVNSFKLLPWIDDHEMLGGEHTAPEDKGVQGVTGEEIYFEDGYLKGNIRLFSESMASDIENGKQELSCGYRCKYEVAVGEFQGQEFDIIQTEIRGNHLALVDEGRMGKEVAVLDKADGIALDSYNITKSLKGLDIMPTPEEIKKAEDDAKDMEARMGKVEEDMKGVSDMCKDMKAMLEKSGKAGDAEEEEEAKAGDAEEEEAKAGDKTDEEKEKEAGDKSAAQDSKIADLEKRLATQETDGFKSFMKQAAQRDGLASQISEHVGTFDHAEMTLGDVAKYGVEKLELECEDGQEVAALQGFFHNRPTVAAGVFAGDSKDGKGGEVTSFLTDSK